MKIKKQKTQQKNECDYNDLDNKFEVAGYVVQQLFKNWQKTLILLLSIIVTIGIVAVILLPGWECDVGGQKVIKTPVELKKEGVR
jgi:hypothetical protein